MNLGLTQVGAISRGPALVMAASVRGVVAQVQPARAVNGVERAEPVRNVEPAKRDIEEPRGQVRQQVLTEKGINLAKIAALGAQERIEVHLAIESEVARRMGGKRLLDIRV